jgi:aralkylamine N-acetyltransferase
MITYDFLTDPTGDQIAQLLLLYEVAGWWNPGPGAAAQLLRLVAGSHCFLVAESGSRIIGMGRVISDGISDAYIQDVTVQPEFRGRGIGSGIVSRLLARLHGDGIEWIGLIAERNSHGFYRRLGFSEMADSVPMLIRNEE